MVGAIDKGQTPDKKLEDEAALALNCILKEMNLEFANLQALVTATFTTVPSQRSYTIADGIPSNIYEISTASYNDSTTNDVKMDIISQEYYEQNRDKTAIGVPQRLYLTKEEPTSTRTIFIFPNPQDARTITLRYWRRLFDVDSPNDDLDFPPEAYSYLTFRLASDLAEEYQVPDNKAQRLFDKSTILMQSLKKKMAPKVSNFPVQERKFF
jgi:hypothetical protein